MMSRIVISMRSLLALLMLSSLLVRPGRSEEIAATLKECMDAVAEVDEFHGTVAQVGLSQRDPNVAQRAAPPASARNSEDEASAPALPRGEVDPQEEAEPKAESLEETPDESKDEAAADSPSHNSDRAALIDQVFGEYDSTHSPGCGVAVVRDGQVVFAKGYGMANLEYGIPITTRTRFDSASVGKQFTAFAILRLDELGTLSLEDDIRTHLPEFPDLGHPITIRHLLHHTSGIRDYFMLLELSGVRPLSDSISQEDVLRVIFRQRELNFPPGEEFLYSNSGYVLLAEILERATGHTMREWLSVNLFQPFGMGDSELGDDYGRIVKDRSESYALAAEETLTFRRASTNYSAYGPGITYTTAEDLATWVTHFKGLKSSEHEILVRLRERGTLNGGRTMDYSFGLSHDTHRGLAVVAHGGSWAGYRTYLGWFPEQDLGVIVLANLASVNARAKAMEVAELYLGEHLESTAKELPSPEAVEIDPSSFDALAGRYLAPGGHVMSFRRNGNRYYLQLVSTDRELELVPASEIEFLLKGFQGGYTFHRDSDGRVTHVTPRNRVEVKAERLEDAPFEPTEEELEAYWGRYESPELEAAYHFVVADGKLVARHPRNAEAAFVPVAKDQFVNRDFGGVRFERDESDRVSGFRVTKDRVRNLWFARRDEGSLPDGGARPKSPDEAPSEP